MSRRQEKARLAAELPVLPPGVEGVGSSIIKFPEAVNPVLTLAVVASTSTPEFVCEAIVTVYLMQHTVPSTFPRESTETDPAGAPVTATIIMRMV